MSTGWYLYCKTCDSYCGNGPSLDNDSGLKLGLRFISLIPFLIANQSIFDEFGLTDEFDRRVPTNWLRDHSSHNIVMRSEYGEEKDKE